VLPPNSITDCYTAKAIKSEMQKSVNIDLDTLKSFITARKKQEALTFAVRSRRSQGNILQSSKGIYKQTINNFNNILLFKSPSYYIVS
jgi:hypothetical protein